MGPDVTALTAEILGVLQRAKNQGGVGSGIYLTKERTDELFAEMSLPRCSGMTMIGTFNRVPIYLDRDVSMVICHDRAGEAYLTFI